MPGRMRSGSRRLLPKQVHIPNATRCRWLHAVSQRLDDGLLGNDVLHGEGPLRPVSVALMASTTLPLVEWSAHRSDRSCGPAGVGQGEAGACAEGVEELLLEHRVQSSRVRLAW